MTGPTIPEAVNARKRVNFTHCNRPDVPGQYTGKRYPVPQQQAVLHSQHYTYQPREPVVQQHYQQHVAPQQHGHVQGEEGHR